MNARHNGRDKTITLLSPGSQSYTQKESENSEKSFVVALIPPL
jgi:hypothetical protein